MHSNPYIKPKRSHTSILMLDVIIALLPLIIVAYLAYGYKALVLLAISCCAALVTDLIFGTLFLKNIKTVLDGTAIITALLLAFTISPATPWYIVAFGASAAVLFGKIVWGGLGKNKFNPALVGREFMVAFFPAIMGSATIWITKPLINISHHNFFPGLKNEYLAEYLSGILYSPHGAMGEYSLVAIALGGLYLLFRNRISWHIPVSLLLVFLSCFWILDTGEHLNFSMGGVLLGAIFMATDMPSSPTNSQGKLYYGSMIGLVAFVLILGNVSFEYMSYSILILNGFSYKISEVFKPTAWSTKLNLGKKTEHIFLLSLAILGVTLAVMSLHYYQLIQWLIYAYISYSILKFTGSHIKKIANPI